MNTLNTLKALTLLTGLTLCAIACMCVKVAFTHHAEPVFADLPKARCELLPSGHCDDARVPYKVEPADMLAAMNVKTRPSIQTAMSAFDER